MELSEREELVEVREMNVSVREKEIEEKKKKFASMEEDMDELYYVLLLKEKELNQGNQNLKEVDQNLKLKEKEIVEHYRVLEEKEMELNVGWKKLETMEKLAREKFRAWRMKENRIDEKSKELDLREKELNDKEKLFNQRNSDLELKENRIDEKSKQLDLREEELNEKKKQFNHRNNDLELKENRIDEKSKELDSREKELNEKEKQFNQRNNDVSRNLKLKENQINEKLKELDLREKELNEKEKQFNDVSKNLELKEKTTNDRFKMLESKEKQIEERFKTMNDRFKMLESKEKQIEERFKTKEKQVDDRQHEIELKEKDIDRRFQELDMKEKHISDLCQQIEECYKVIDLKEKEQESTRTQMKKQNYEARRVEDYTEKQSDEQIVESSSIQVSQGIPHSEVPQAVCVDNSSGKIGGDFHILCRNMDPDGVKSYLSERWMERKLIHEDLLDALTSAPDPAKLVLDVFQIYYWKYTSSDEARATKIGCRILLENLVKLSPLIAVNVTDKAKVFADSWKARLKGVDNSRDTYDFLTFVAAFKLASFYDADELLSLFDIFYRGNVVYQPDDNPFLCHALGLSNKIPGIIKSLVQRQEWLLALKYVCVFKLESDFPPVPLLEAYLELIGKRANDRHRDRTFESQDEAYRLELVSLYEVLNCVRNLKLEQKFPIDFLVSRIQSLENAKENREYFALPQMKQRGTSYCASVEHTGQQEKRPRVGHDIHPNWHQEIAYAYNGPSYNEFHPHVGFGQLVPPTMHPFGAPRPACYDGPFLGPLG